MIRPRRAVAILLLAHNFPTRSAAGLKDNAVETEGPTVFRLREEHGKEVTAFPTYKRNFDGTFLLVPALASVSGLEDDSELTNDPASAGIDKCNVTESKVFGQR